MTVEFIAGDKVFLIPEQRIATILNTYGDGVRGDFGEMRLDVSGNTLVTEFEKYDPVRHAAFDHTFVPIRRQWKEDYGITQDVELKDETAPSMS